MANVDRKCVGRRSRTIGLVLVVPLVLVSCARPDADDTVVAPSDPATTATTPTSTTVAPAPTSAAENTTSSTEPEPPTTTLPATTTPTTIPPTTSTSSTTTPPTTTPPTTTEPPVVAPLPTSAIVSSNGQLLDFDVASDSAKSVIVEFFDGEGVFRAEVTLTPDRTAAYFSEYYEDAWYSCDPSQGSIGLVDLATGTLEVVEVGTGPSLSSDGTQLSFLASNLCLPDPDQPDFWVLTPYDKVVVRDLSTSELTEYVTATPPDSYLAPGALRWAGFDTDDNLLVLTEGGDIHRVQPGGSNVVQDHPIVLSGFEAIPVGVTPTGLLAILYGDEGSSDLQLVDIDSGMTALLASSEGFMHAGVSNDGHIAVVASSEVTVHEPSLVTVLGDGEFNDSVDW